MSRFKIGERVEIVSNSRHKGERGRIVRISDNHGDLGVRLVYGDVLWFMASEVELVLTGDDALDLAIWGAGLNLSSLDEVMQEEQEKEIERAFDEPVNKLRSRIEELERAIRAMGACLATDDPLYDLHMRIADKALGREYE
jgi:hypothetical protein